MSGMHFPQMRFELEGMKHTLMVHLGKYHEDLEKLVDESCQNVIENFDFERAIKANLEAGLNDALREAISAHFRYGVGKKVVAAALKDALEKLEGRDEG